MAFRYDVDEVLGIDDPKKRRERWNRIVWEGGVEAFQFMQDAMVNPGVPLQVKMGCASQLLAVNAAQMRYEAAQEDPNGNVVRIEIGENARSLLSKGVTACDTYEPEAAERAGLPPAVWEDGDGGKPVDIECVDKHEA